MRRRPPRSTRIDTLSLHDALPISGAAMQSLLMKSKPFCQPASQEARLLLRKEISCSAIDTLFTPAIKRSEEHTSELQSLMRISYAVFCLKKKKKTRITGQQYYITRYNNKENKSRRRQDNQI